MAMQRRSFQHDGLTFSYLDSLCDGPMVVALHAHMMEATTFSPLAADLGPNWRVVALDQRGQGHSSHALSYTRADYLGDIEALLEHLGVEQAVLLGNSLGGVNAYQFAAKYPTRVLALVIEDIGAVISDDISFILPWGGVFTTREELENRIGPRFVPYFQDSFRQTEDGPLGGGWKLGFEPSEMVESQRQLVGDHWLDWLASRCPALLIRGRESRVTNEAQCSEMTERRANTKLLTLDGGHVLHFDDPAGFNASVRKFLNSLKQH